MVSLWWGKTQYYITLCITLDFVPRHQLRFRGRFMSTIPIKVFSFILSVSVLSVYVRVREPAIKYNVITYNYCAIISRVPFLIISRIKPWLGLLKFGLDCPLDGNTCELWFQTTTFALYTIFAYFDCSMSNISVSKISWGLIVWLKSSFQHLSP